MKPQLFVEGRLAREKTDEPPESCLYTTLFFLLVNISFFFRFFMSNQ